MRFFQFLLMGLLAIHLSGCGSSNKDKADMEWSQGISAIVPRTLGVNAYLWQATLDTLSFLPIVKADPFGGVIISDWYSPRESPNERLKITVYITDRALRAEGLKIRVFRQVYQGGEWQYVQANPGIARKLEDVVLTRARELRIGALNGVKQ